MKTGCFVLLIAVVAPGGAAAQGLGDAAQREKKKRAEQKAPAHANVFTDADLTRGKPDAAEAAAAEPEAEGSAGEHAPVEGGASTQAQAKGAGEGGAMPPPELADPALEALERERAERKLLEAEWRTRFANAREELALAEAACWKDVVRTEFYQGVPVQMRVKEFVESEAFRQAKQALADLEEEFRRTGLPPGWTR